MTSLPKTRKIQSMISIVKKFHKHQSRNNGKTPYWHHCVSVAEILNAALSQSKELQNNPRLKTNILLAALGHDLYEDTKITRAYVVKNFGPEVDEMIFNLTNEKGDFDRDAYHKKIKNGPEEALLIKLCDLNDNIIGCAYNMHTLGHKWIKQFLMPIVSDMSKIVKNRKYEKYPSTAKILLQTLDFSNERLYNNYTKPNTK